MTKSELSKTLQTKRREWNAVLASVNPARLDIPGAAGHWSVKDVVAHITAYERWLVEWLTAASQRTFPAQSPLDDANIERRNARVFEMTRRLSLEQVLDDAQKSFEALLQIIEILPNEYFTNPQCAEWFMKPYWNKMNTVPDAIMNLSVDHYEEHKLSIKTWVDEENLE